MEEVKFTHEDVEYKISKPTSKIRKESDAVYAKAYRKAIAEGLFLEAEIDNILKDRGIKAYNDKEKKAIESEISTLEKRFISNAFSSYNEGLDAYNKIIGLRKEIEDLDKARRELSTQAASIFAENERFSYFVFACAMTVDGEKIWEKVDDYKEDASHLAVKFSSEMINIIYGGTGAILQELESIRPENIWYKTYHESLAEERDGDSERPEESAESTEEEKPKKKKKPKTPALNATE